MQKRSFLLVLAFMAILGLLAMPTFAQDDNSEDMDSVEEIYDLDGDGVNIDFPDVDQFDTNSYVRFAHLAPGVGDVDIYVNGELMDGLTGVGFEVLGDWIAVEPGGYNVQVVATGDDIENAVIDVDSFPLVLGQWVTVAAVLDDEGNPDVATAVQDFSEPLPGVTNLTFFNALSMSESVTFYRDGIPFIANLGETFFETNTYSYAIPVDTSTYTFSATLASDTDGQLLATTDEVIDLNEWSSYLIMVYGDAEGNSNLLVDETSPAEAAVLRGWLPEDGTILDALAYNEALQPYVGAIDLAGLVDTVNGEGPFTLFIPAGYLADEILLVADGDADVLARILTAHVYEGAALYSQDLIAADSLIMANGNEIPVIVDGDAIFVGGAQVIDVNIPATNGVIHVIGYVIDPSLDQEDYDLFDDAVNLESSADQSVIDDIADGVEDAEDMDDEDMDDMEATEEAMDDEDSDE